MKRKMFEVDTTEQLFGIGICWSSHAWEEGWHFFGILLGPLVFRLNWKHNRSLTPTKTDK